MWQIHSRTSEGLLLKTVLKKKKKQSLTYSFRLGFDHFHERSSRLRLHHFFFGDFPGVQELQLGQLVQNKVPAREQQQTIQVKLYRAAALKKGLSL